LAEFVVIGAKSGCLLFLTEPLIESILLLTFMFDKPEMPECLEMPETLDIPLA
jgi:hypothetical protein